MVCAPVPLNVTVVVFDPVLKSAVPLLAKLPAIRIALLLTSSKPAVTPFTVRLKNWFLPVVLAKSDHVRPPVEVNTTVPPDASKT